jgi:hypothetical protein
MKPTIVLERKSDIEIIRALLPADLLAACQLVGSEGRSTLVSVARTHIIKHHAPTAVMLDTDTLDPTIIAEIVQTTRHLIGAVAGDTAFDIIYCIPHLEAIFFEASVDLQRIFPNFDHVYILQFAKTQPKDQLNVLFEKGGGPRRLNQFLDELTSEGYCKTTVHVSDSAAYSLPQEQSRPRDRQSCRYMRCCIIPHAVARDSANWKRLPTPFHFAPAHTIFLT